VQDCCGGFAVERQGFVFVAQRFVSLGQDADDERLVLLDL
jgi:hypothetical protein